MTSLVNALDLYRSSVGPLIGDLVYLVCMCYSEISDFLDY